MHRYYCSYFDRNYLLKAVALISSLNRVSRTPFTLYAVCLDELTRVILERIALPNVVAVPLHKVEENDQDLLAAKQNRNTVEYYWTLTPTVLLWLLEQHPEIGVISYLDADLFFFSEPEPIFRELGSDSILIHGHRFPESMKELEKFGKYNVGLLSFRRDEAGREALMWWRERCNEWCYCIVQDGKFGDQLYLDDWTERFGNVRVLEHPGAGVAPWNHIQYHFKSLPGGAAAVDDSELIFYHFHALEFVRPGVVVPAKFLNYPLREDVIACCFVPYLEELLRALRGVREILPDFSFGLFNDQVLSADHTILAKRGYGAELKRLGLQHPVLELKNGWHCHCSPQMQPVHTTAAPLPFPAEPPLFGSQP